MTIKENYLKKANYIVELLGSEGEKELPIRDENPEAEEAIEDEPEENPKAKKPSFEMDDEGDISVETAKSILSAYIDKCVEEGTKELGSEYGLDDIEGSYEIVQEEIERIAKQLQNYLKKGVQ